MCGEMREGGRRGRQAGAGVIEETKGIFFAVDPTFPRATATRGRSAPGQCPWRPQTPASRRACWPEGRAARVRCPSSLCVRCLSSLSLSCLESGCYAQGCPGCNAAAVGGGRFCLPSARGELGAQCPMHKLPMHKLRAPSTGEQRRLLALQLQCTLGPLSMRALKARGKA